VTGAASGIGRATVLALANRGARPVLLGPSGGALAEVAAECAARGAAALPLTVDVTDTDVDVVAGAARQAVERFGRLDGWVAVPDDTAVTPVGPLQAVPSADLRRQWAVTVLGAVHGAGAALPYMTAQGEGCWWSSPRWSGRSPGPTPPPTA
jgi:NAD(P)-dependent dehydrogenase (short-subunit alcohol dehydrogenase family)